MNEGTTIVNVKSNTGGFRLNESANVSVGNDDQEFYSHLLNLGEVIQAYPPLSPGLLPGGEGLQKVVIKANEPIENVNIHLKIEGPKNFNIVITKNIKERLWILQFVPPIKITRDGETTTVNVHLGEDEGDNYKAMHVVAAGIGGIGIGTVAGAVLAGISYAAVGVVAAASLSLAGYLWRRANRM